MKTKRFYFHSKRLKKYIKHLISLLIIFGLTVNECSIYAQEASVKYYQVSNAVLRSKFNHKDSKLYVSNQQIFLEKELLTFLFKYLNLRSFHNKQVQLILKLQTQVYQEKHLIQKLHFFLKKRIDSLNSYPTTYIA